MDRKIEIHKKCAINMMYIISHYVHDKSGLFSFFLGGGAALALLGPF